jgi:hypothetical protein
MKRILLGLAFILTPLAVYWGTVFHEFGFRDDYSLLREVHEEPGKVPRVTTSNGRPVYGAMLVSSLRPVHGVPDLSWLRLASVLFLTGAGWLLWRQLRRSGWTEAEAAALGLAVPLLPAAQVVAAWAIAWPLAVALLLAVGGFTLIESNLARSDWRRSAGVLGGALLYCIAGLIYQSNALFAVVPLAGALLLRPQGGVANHARWTVLHLSILFVSLVAGLAFVELLFTEGVAPQSPRMHLDTEPLSKLWWFVKEPLANAAALFALRDKFNTGALWFWGSAALCAALVAFGWRFGPADRSHRVRWLVCLLFLPFVAHAVSLASAARVNGYRTLFALCGIVLVLAAYGLRSLRTSGRISLRAQHAALGVLTLVAAGSAAYNAYALIAAPQNLEWVAMREAADRVALEVNTSVYIIAPTPGLRATQRMFSDEFGSLSSDSDWVPQEMFKTAIRERFPEGVPPECRFTLTASHDVPDAAADFDAVIDLRRFADESVERRGFLVSTVPNAESCPVVRKAQLPAANVILRR